MRSPRSLRRLTLMATLLVLATALGACGHKEANPMSADSEGPYVRSGGLTYQVQLSRQLNQYSVEDHGYLAGVKTTPPKPNQMWLAIFMWAKNESHHNLTTTNRFDLVDTDGNRYYPVAINSSLNPYAWTSQTLKPLGTEPVPDSTAAFGPTQGAELLFKVDTTVYSNRPITLEIHAPGESQPTSISIDL